MIGRMKDRITLQKPVLTPDEGGGFTTAWEDVAEVYASVIPVSAGEYLKGHQLETSVTHRIIIRYREDVTPSLRIVRGAKVYDISSAVDQGGLKAYLEILAAERVPA